VSADPVTAQEIMTLRCIGALMENRFSSCRLKIASHLVELLDEARNYHRKDGQIIKEDDDLLSALRQAVMDIRHARPLAPAHPGRFWRDGRHNTPEAIEARKGFDVFTGLAHGAVHTGADTWGRDDSSNPCG
jgi:hypothetical protein